LPPLRKRQASRPTSGLPAQRSQVSSSATLEVAATHASNAMGAAEATDMLCAEARLSAAGRKHWVLVSCHEGEMTYRLELYELTALYFACSMDRCFLKNCN
jgi:hypothetical protein